MQRIILLGSAGVGKTTLARKLAARLSVPAIILDEIWRPGWGHDEVPAFRETIRQLHAGDAWISDGNFANATFDIRLPRADVIVWLEAPRALAVWRVISRTFRPGETHQFQDIAKALQFIAAFDRINRPRIEGLRLQIAPETPVIHANARDAWEIIIAADKAG